MYLRAKSIVIRERRKKLGYTQADVAKAAGIGPMSLNRMEKDKYGVHPLRAKAVAEVLGCKVDDLFEEVEQKIS